jgi:NAD(P)-dependent dehydrogenase (short-subunit alcohol dehydrogenase family)
MQNDLFDLSGKTALVTGANSGLGFAYARGLARAGADIMIWGRRREQNEQAAAKLAQFGGRVLSNCVDVASEPDVIAGVQDAVARLGRLDCLVANAGFATRVESTAEMDSAMYHSLLDVNLHGAFYTLREVARHMVERSKTGGPGGSIIICGSLSIARGVPGMGHYAASKGALNSLSKTMAVELGPHQIRVNVVAPGFVATEMTQADPEVYKALEKQVSESTPLGRVGVPEEFEGIAIYLASDCSRYHTGDTIVIDGGNSLC